VDVTIYFASHVAAALVLALPTTALVAGTGIGRFPDGDRLLFQPGGVIATEVARAVTPALSAQSTASLTVATMVSVLLLLPHAALLVTLSGGVRRPRSVTWGRAIGHLPSLAWLSGVGLLAQAITAFGMLSLAGMLRNALAAGTARSADLVYLSVLALGLLLTLVIGLARDLGRAAVVSESLGSKVALYAGCRALARAPGHCLLAWAAPAAAGFALVALGAAVTAWLDVARPGTWRVWLVALVHQGIAYALCFCRAFWLKASLELVKSPNRVSP
jgi:hypothetical protein